MPAASTGAPDGRRTWRRAVSRRRSDRSPTGAPEPRPGRSPRRARPPDASRTTRAWRRGTLPSVRTTSFSAPPARRRDLTGQRHDQAGVVDAAQPGRGGRRGRRAAAERAAAEAVREVAPDVHATGMTEHRAGSVASGTADERATGGVVPRPGGVQPGPTEPVEPGPEHPTAPPVAHGRDTTLTPTTPPAVPVTGSTAGVPPPPAPPRPGPRLHPLSGPPDRPATAITAHRDHPEPP